MTFEMYNSKLRDKIFVVGIPVETVRLLSSMSIHSTSFSIKY